MPLYGLKQGENNCTLIICQPVFLLIFPKPHQLQKNKHDLILLSIILIIWMHSLVSFDVLHQMQKKSVVYRDLRFIWVVKQYYNK